MEISFLKAYYVLSLAVFLDWQIEGKITIRLENGKDKEHWSLTVGCSLPGKWALHWGVNYIGDAGRYY